MRFQNVLILSSQIIIINYHYEIQSYFRSTTFFHFFRLYSCSICILIQLGLDYGYISIKRCILWCSAFSTEECANCFLSGSGTALIRELPKFYWQFLIFIFCPQNQDVEDYVVARVAQGAKEVMKMSHTVNLSFYGHGTMSRGQCHF